MLTYLHLKTSSSLHSGRNVDIGAGLPGTTPRPTEEAVTEDSLQTTANVDPATTIRPEKTARPTSRPTTTRRTATTAEDTDDWDDDDDEWGR